MFPWQQIDEESEPETSSASSLGDDEVIYSSRERPSHVVICGIMVAAIMFFFLFFLCLFISLCYMFEYVYC